MRNEWKVYFLFSEKEQKGMLVLGCILLFSSLLSLLLPTKPSDNRNTITPSVAHFIVFEFDPNTIDSSKALLLGIPPKQVHTLLNYRRKGGRFYRKEQLANLYGLSPLLAEKLIPFVRINGLNNRSVYYNKFKESTNGRNNFTWVIDINNASETEWMQKTNLSKPTVQRIMRYKNYLGNFEKVQQIKKVYGLSDADYDLLHGHMFVGKTKPVKLVANTMNFKNWQSLSMFTHKEIGIIIKTRKGNGGRIGWREIVILCDLTENQATSLKQKITIND